MMYRCKRYSCILQLTICASDYKDNQCALTQKCASHYKDNQFFILSKARSDLHLSVLESIFITLRKPNFCRQKEFVCKHKMLVQLKKFFFSFKF